jgi:hypothetical protein
MLVQSGWPGRSWTTPTLCATPKTTRWLSRPGLACCWASDGGITTARAIVTFPLSWSDARKRCVEDWKNYFAHFQEDPKYFVHFPDVTAEKSPDEDPSLWTRQGVDVTQAIQYPVLYYLMSKDETDKDSVIQGMANLDKGYGQVGARWSGDEWLANTDPTQGTELCDVEELLYSLEKNFEAVGNWLLPTALNN